MFKKFLSAIILVFAFLFLNVSEVKAVENTSGLPDEVFEHAGIGNKMGYWAVVNYGEDYVDSDKIVIDIDKNAISNLDIQYIMIDETEFTGVGGKTYYKRNEDKEFSSKIEYTLKNKFIGEKSVAILLLRELSNDPIDSLIVDKIIVEINHKRTLDDPLFKDEYIKITQTLNAYESSATINVTLDNSVIDQYVIKNVKYRFTKDEVALNAIEADFNTFEFIAYQNGMYAITLEDVFGVTRTINFEVTGIKQPPIVLEAVPYVVGPTRFSYDVLIYVYELQGEDRIQLYYDDIIEGDPTNNLKYTFKGNTKSILTQLKDGEFYFNVEENGVYTISCLINGYDSQLILKIDNIDREAPFMQVANNLIVYTESIDLFVPENEVFVYDNVTSGEYLMETLEIKYYYFEGINKVELDDYSYHLYSVREMYISYTVTDEAGNSTTMECMVNPIDDTKPTISHSTRKMILYINDTIANVAGTNKRIENFFNLEVTDNSLYEGSTRTITYTKTWDLATITDSNGNIKVSELTKNGRIFVVARDEAGNESDMIILPVEVCERLIKIEAKEYQFSVYGEYSPSTNVIQYHCIDVLRDEDGSEILDEYGNTIPAYVDCNTLLLEGDKLIGYLYIEDARYVDKYEIKYDKINVPSKLYSLDYGDNYEYIKYEIIPIKLKVIAKDRGKLYLDKDPDFSDTEASYYVDNTVCNLTPEEEYDKYVEYYENLKALYPQLDLTDVLFEGDIYRCKELEGDKLKGQLDRWRGTIDELIDEGYADFINTYVYEVDGVGEDELVWYIEDGEGNEVPVSRPIRDPGKEHGGLYIDEGVAGLNNYVIDFIEGEFTIFSKDVNIKINNKEKIYGEEDPVFDIGECKVPVYVGDVNDTDGVKDGYMYVEDCFKELQLSISREEGETVYNGDDEQYYYLISGQWLNKNYSVTFDDGYLRINQRNIDIHIKGDEGTPGKYTITYEDDLPTIEIVDVSYDTDKRGLVTLDRNILGIDDRFNHPIEFIIYDSRGFELEYYVDENGNLVPDYAADNTYYIRLNPDRVLIIDKDGNESDSNYILNYTEGEIFVVKKDIHVKVKEEVLGRKLLEKIYGDDDAIYSSADLEAMFPGQKYVILDSNNNFFIEIASNTTLDNGEVYIPRDNKTMKYYLARERRDTLQGIYVGEYPVFIEYLEGCDNYNVYLNGNPIYKILKRDMKIIIGNQTIVYRDETPISDFTYDVETAEKSLQYQDYRYDRLEGEPDFEVRVECYIGVNPGGELEYCNVGDYYIDEGSIRVMDIDNNNVSRNYNFIVTKGNVKVIKRTITIKSLGAEKKYGAFDPVFNYVCIHEGEQEECNQLEGYLYRETLYDAVEIPRTNPDGSVYEYPLSYLDADGNQTLNVKNVGTKAKPIYNYEIIDWDLERGLKINKLNITLIPNSSTVIYGADYSEQLFFKVEGDDPAYNLMIVVGKDEIDGSDITLEDHIQGDLVIVNGPVNGSGVYTISCEAIKLVRRINREDVDVSSYYNITRREGTLTVNPRILEIKVKDGLTKVYGEEDPNWGDLNALITVSCQGAQKCLVDDNHVIVGSLIRKPIFNAAGNLVTEDAGTYEISIENLKVIDKNNGDLDEHSGYVLELAGKPTFVITKRNLLVKATWITIQYVETVEEIELTYTIEGRHGLASRDTLSGELNLSPEYAGCGVYHDDTHKGSKTICGSYAIVKGTLSLTNEHNYEGGWFEQGVMLVSKREITVTPDPNYLYKVYRTEDPIFRFTLDYPASYSGKLTREPGEDVGTYKILMDELYFSNNYNVTLVPSVFTITPRNIKIEVKEGLGKIYLDDDPIWSNLSELIKISGTIVEPDELTGTLRRDEGESVGKYAIRRGNLSIRSTNPNNYNITFIEGIFEIYYVEVTELKIEALTNNKYQVYNETTQVRVEAQFNRGANPALLNDVEWTVVKRLNNGDQSDFRFDRNATTNIVSFLPIGDVGTYIVTARYKGLTATYEVLVEMSTVRNVYIKLEQSLSGSINQILGREEWMTYSYTVTGEVRDNNVVRWYVNDKLMKESPAKDFEYFTFKPDGKGTYEVYAQIVNKASEPLYVYVENNNSPVIKLIGDPVIYIEAKSGELYVDKGFGYSYEVSDDITSREWLETHKIEPSGLNEVDVNKIGTYFIRYDAVDEHGNYAISIYRQIVVRDITPPVVELNKCADGNYDMVLLFGEPYIECGATAKDNYDGEDLKIYVNNQINLSRIGVYEVVYTAYDSSGNVGSATRYVEIIDNISPRITLIGSERMYVEVYHEFEDPGADVHDNVDGDFIIYASSFYYGDKKVASIDTSVIGIYYAHYDYTDSVGNVGATQVRVVEVRDSTPPVITLKGRNPYVVRYSRPMIEFEDPGAIVTDNYDTDLTYTVTGEIGDELGTYYLYYNAIDSNNNRAATVIRQVVVIDVRNPILTFDNEAMCPQYMTLEALYDTYDKRCDVAGFGIYIEDDYNEDRAELYKRLIVKGSVDTTTVGTYVITYDVVDVAGNAAVTLYRYVKVVDTTAPEIELIGGGKDGEQIVEVFEEYIELGARITDRYDDYHGKTITTNIIKDVRINKLGEYDVIYTAVDSNGNKATPVVRKVYVKDTKPPVITLNGESSIVIERGVEYVEYGATVMDNYDGPITKYTISNAPSGMIYGTYRVVYRAVDSSGNIGEAVRIVKVDDTIPPIVLGVEDGAYYKNPVSIYFVPTIGTNETLRGWLNGKEITSPWFVEDEGTYDLHVEDDAGNYVDIRFYIDNTPPEILGIKNGEYTNQNVNIYSNEKIKYYQYRYQSGDWIKTEDQTVSFDREGLYRIYAVDMADNISSTVMFVIDKTDPIYTLTGVVNKGITRNSVNLIVEENATIVVNSMYSIDNNYTFTNDGYYQVVIRDLANNVVSLQFVINEGRKVMVDEKIIDTLDQYNAINKLTISGNYPRNSGYMIAKPLLEGGFEYVSGKLFSEEEYQKLLTGQSLEYKVSATDDTYMFVAFVVESDELNKFGSQTVDGDKGSEDDEEDDNSLYILLFLGVALIGGGFMWFFLKRRRREEEEEEVDEIIVDDY